MMKHVSKVMAGCSTSAATIDAMNLGEIGVFDKNGKLVTSPAGAVKGEPFMIGIADEEMDVVLADGTIQSTNTITFGNYINPCRVTSNTRLVPYKAPVENVLTIDMTNVFCTTGFRYVLRILYKDIYELKSQYTKSYEVVSTATDTPITIAQAFVDMINKDSGRRVTATLTGAVITLTGLVKPYGKYDQYSQVTMDASVYTTDPLALSSVPVDAGAVVTKVQAADPGDGNAKVIRDRELEMLPYKGVTNFTQFPVISPNLRVNLNAKYDTITIEYDSCYRSNDNQYVKNTPKVDEIYIDNSSDSSAVWNIVKVYLGL